MKTSVLCLSWALCSVGLVLADDLVGDPVTGKQKASTCIACHGDHGGSAKANVPKIDRMPPEIFVRALNEMQEAHHDLPITAHALSEQDVEDIAAYFAYGE